MKKFDYDKIYDFGNLYQGYLASRRSKRGTREVIQFEMDPGMNLCRIQEELRSEQYHLSGYYHFTVYDPKVREIYAAIFFTSGSNIRHLMTFFLLVIHAFACL